jgi:hypothetical protein
MDLQMYNFSTFRSLIPYVAAGCAINRFILDRVNSIIYVGTNLIYTNYLKF